MVDMLQTFDRWKQPQELRRSLEDYIRSPVRQVAEAIRQLDDQMKVTNFANGIAAGRVRYGKDTEKVADFGTLVVKNQRRLEAAGHARD